MFSKRKYMGNDDSSEMELKRQRYLNSNQLLPGASFGSSVIDTVGYANASHPPPFPVVRLRGLPFDCTEVDVADFLHGLNIIDILFIHKGGRFSGEAFCVLAYPLQVEFAVQRNRQNMGPRYIEVFRSKRQEYYSAVAHETSEMRGGTPHLNAPRGRPYNEGKDLVEHSGVLRMRGLPYSAGKDDVLDFFADFELSEDRVHIVLNSDGKATGEAFVEFLNAGDSRSAMTKDRMTLGSRYIELFPSTAKEMDEAVLVARRN